jgi:CBS-domain-containing membrane protein
MLHSGSAILQVAVAGCGLQVAGHKYKMSPVAMHTLKLIVVYYS